MDKPLRDLAADRRFPPFGGSESTHLLRLLRPEDSMVPKLHGRREAGGRTWQQLDASEVKLNKRWQGDACGLQMF